MQNVIVERFSDLPFNDKQIMRFLGVKRSDSSIDALILECKNECAFSFDLAVCYSLRSVKIVEQTIDFGDFSLTSKDLSNNLNRVKQAVVFVATVGFGIDRLIKKYSNVSPAKALTFSAIGSERVETLCDKFCERIKTKYGSHRARFSAGYGDLSLDCQKQIFNALSVTKNLGVTLNDSLLMSPTKSVSAFVGIGACDKEVERCAICAKSNCKYR